MLIGNPAEVSELEEILKSIDVEIPPTESFSAARIQMVDLKNAIADDLAKTLNDLIAVDRGAGGAAGGGGSAGAKGESIVRRLMIKTPDGQELPPLDLDRPIKILPDKARNALVIYSSQKNLEALQTITQAFDTLPVGEEIDVKSFVLQHAQAQKLAETLNKMFDDAKKTIGRAADLSGSGKEKGVMPPQPQGM
ncbi:MAG: hypothetical protein HZB38_14940, partial [Planctomycetes bacterium]|nr:hypothetical protein [Planctomycetota bacterium]